MRWHYGYLEATKDALLAARSYLIAQKFVQQVLTDYPLSTEWERVASVTGLTKEEIIAAIKEGKKEDTSQLLQECLTKSPSLDEKIVRMMVEGFTPFFICKVLGISQSRIDLVMESPDISLILGSIYGTLSAKNVLNQKEQQFIYYFRHGGRFFLSDFCNKVAVHLYTNGMSVHDISQMLEMSEEDVQKELWGFSHF